VKASGERLYIITGHYGSGKTEFAVNFSMALAAGGHPVSLADLDVVNPYFCSRERKAELESAGVRVILSNAASSDLPAINPAVLALLEPGMTGVMDVGGDAAGARVLGRFAERIQSVAHEVFCVLNFRRPETATAKHALDYLREIEHSAKLSVTGLVNNTHLCGETRAEDVHMGAKKSEELSVLTGIPVVYHAAMRGLTNSIQVFSGELFPIDIYMKKPWEFEPIEEE